MIRYGLGFHLFVNPFGSREMRKLVLSLVTSTALACASAANAGITIGTVGTETGSSIVVQPPDNVPTPETVDFSTTSNQNGTFTSYFDFSNTDTGFYNFSLITSTLNAEVTLEQLLDGSMVQLQFSQGTGNSLSLLTNTLMAGATYRFTYTSLYPVGGGTTTGNASFYAQSAVPEAASWALMLLGFGGIGLAMRRKRRPGLAQLA